MLATVSNSVSLHPPPWPPYQHLSLAQTSQDVSNPQMANEIMQTMKENDDSDKKKMGMAKFHTMDTVRKILRAKNKASSNLAEDIDKILAEPVKKHKTPDPPP